MSRWLRAGMVLVNGADARTLAKQEVRAEQQAIINVARAEADRFAAEMVRRVREPHVVLGHTSDGTPFVVTLSQLDSGFRAAVSGLPGSGKTMAAIILLFWIASRALLVGDVAALGLSIKPDIVESVVRLLALMLARLPRAERRRALTRLQVFTPFSRVRGWGLLEPQPGVPVATHASVVVEALMGVRSGMRLGEVQTPCLHALVILAITLGWSLLDLLLALLDPSTIVPAAERCPHAETRIFLTTRFPRLGRSVIDGIASRLRMLLATDALRAVFARVGPAFDTRRACEPGSVTLVCTGGADLGSEAASQAMNAIVIATGLGFAMADPARRADAPVLTVIDEAHVPAAIPSAGEAIQAAFSRGRAWKIAPVVISQAESQFDARMREVLDATVTTRWLFAGSHADMANARTLVAPSGASVRPRKLGEHASPELILRSDAEESAALVRRLAELKPREALVHERYARFRGQFVRTRDLRIPDRSELDPDVLAELEECAGIRVGEAAALVRAQEEAALGRLGLGRGPVPDLAAPPELHRAPRDRGPTGGAL